MWRCCTPTYSVISTKRGIPPAPGSTRVRQINCWCIFFTYPKLILVCSKFNQNVMLSPYTLVYVLWYIFFLSCALIFCFAMSCLALVCSVVSSFVFCCHAFCYHNTTTQYHATQHSTAKDATAWPALQPDMAIIFKCQYSPSL